MDMRFDSHGYAFSKVSAANQIYCANRIIDLTNMVIISQLCWLFNQPICNPAPIT
jgi:hypothetical protein